MIDNLVCVKSFSAPPVDKREVLRYAGVRESTPEMEKMLDECIALSEDKLGYNVCYRIFEIKKDGDTLDLGFASVKSKSLMINLEGCDRIALFCATVGSAMDRLIAKYSVVSPSRAVMLQALGSERVEALCDTFCQYLGESFSFDEGDIKRRFSPGYGDLPLSLQRDVFAAIDCTAKIGVTLNSDMFMLPSKSVTAIVGIKCK